MLRAADTDIPSQSAAECAPPSASLMVLAASAAQASASACSLYVSFLCSLAAEHRLEGDDWITASPLHLRDEDRDFRLGDRAFVRDFAAVDPPAHDALLWASQRTTERRSAA
jgi:hypothetical protein